jgi:hypothetical protein
MTYAINFGGFCGENSGDLKWGGKNNVYSLFKKHIKNIYNYYNYIS